MLWGNAWINFIMEGADQARYRKGSRPAPVVDSIEEAKAVLGRR